MAINQQVAGLRAPAPDVRGTGTGHSLWQSVHAWWWRHWGRPTQDRAIRAHIMREYLHRTPQAGQLRVGGMMVEDARTRRIG